MIQRIQTLFLMGSCLLNGGLYFTSLPEHIRQDPVSWLNYTFISLWLGVIFLSSITILFFNHRVIQLINVYFILLLQVFLFGFATGITFSQGGIGFFLWDEIIALIMILGCICFLIGAIIGIRKDEQLIRSLNRLS